jgi:hypothetical protein
MPTMNVSAFAPLPEVVLPGKPAYLYGSFATDTQDTLLQVTNVALTSNVATVSVYVRAGNIPVVGNLISIAGTQGASGAFNVSSVALTGVSINATAGIGTVTFALVHADVVSAADSGQALVPIQEVPETLAANTSVPVYVPSQEPNDMGEKSITTAITFPTMPTAATVKLYSAINLPKNLPGSAGSEWTLVGTVATVAAAAQTVGPLFTEDTSANTAALAGRFFCLQVTGVTGSGLIVAKLIS